MKDAEATVNLAFSPAVSVNGNKNCNHKVSKVIKMLLRYAYNYILKISTKGTEQGISHLVEETGLKNMN